MGTQNTEVSSTKIDTDFFESNFEYCSVESLEFVMSEAKIKLDSTIDNFKGIRSKTERLISTILPSIIVLLIYLIKSYGSDEIHDLLIPGVVTFVILVISLILLWIAYKTDVFYNGGVLPSSYMTDFYFDKEALKTAELYKNLLLARIYDYEKEIIHNVEKNDQRIKFLDYSWNILLLIPLTPLTLLL